MKNEPKNGSVLDSSPIIASDEDSSISKTSNSTISDEDSEEIDLKASSTTRLCLAKNILTNVSWISIAKGLWENLEQIHQAKSLPNQLYLKEQFHTLRIEEGTRISDHMCILNGIILDLEAIGVVIFCEEKELPLIWSLPTSYELMKSTLVYGKDTVIYS